MKSCRKLSHFVKVRAGTFTHPFRVFAAVSVLNCAAALLAVCQTQSNALLFEVASVKRSSSDHLNQTMPFLTGTGTEEALRFRGGPGTNNPDRIDYSGVTLKMLLRRAYDVKADQILGAKWLDTERYDISAILPPRTSREQLRIMLQALLIDRFQIHLHRESKTLAVYNLTAGKKNPKLTPAEKLVDHDDEAASKDERLKRAREILNDHITARNNGEARPERFFSLPRATLGELAEKLSTYVDRPVLDRTQLDGRYQFKLSWTPEPIDAQGNRHAGPDIFAAIQEQLGLKMEPQREQVEVLVIDSAEKIPTSN